MSAAHPIVNTTESLIRMLALTAALSTFFITFVVAPFLLPMTVGGQPQSGPLPIAAWISWFSYSLLFLIIALGAFFVSPSLIRRRYGLSGQPVNHSATEALVKELSSRIGLKHSPKLHMTELKRPSAFVFGKRTNSATLVVAHDLVRILEPSELEAIILHELSHIRNRDVSFMTWGVAFAGALKYWFPILIGIDLSLQLWYGMLRLDQLNELLSRFLLVLVVFVVTPMIMVCSVSRIREFLADARASLYLEDCNRLVSALKKTARRLLVLSIFGALTKKKGRFAFRNYPLSAFTFATHPKFDRRLSALRKAEYVVSSGRVYLPSWETSVYAGILAFYFFLAGTFVLTLFLSLLQMKLSDNPVFPWIYFSAPLGIIIFLNSYGYVKYSDFSFLGEKVSKKQVPYFAGIFLRNAVSSLTLLLAMVLFAGFNLLEFSLVIFVFYLLISFLVSLVLPIVKFQTGKRSSSQL